MQNKDGGWGEGGESYALDYAGYIPAPSTLSQTAWALLGLMAAGLVEDKAVTLGVALSYADSGGGMEFWKEERFSDGISPGLFSALSRLREIFPAFGRWRASAV
jgi:squalene-hopene/tetraprenyl-beta-curcumene cyclase